MVNDSTIKGGRKLNKAKLNSKIDLICKDFDIKY